MKHGFRDHKGLNGLKAEKETKNQVKNTNMELKFELRIV